MLKFIHAGDAHLGNAFVGLRDVPDWLIEKLQKATLEAFKELIETALNEDVDIVLLPGDVYNTNELNPRIQLFLMEQLERLKQNNIPVILSYGNHDFMSSVEQLPVFPKNVHVFGPNVETFYLVTDHGDKVAVSGFSYPTRHITENRVKEFPSKQVDETYHIGMYHGALGAAGVGDYAPFNLNDMNAKRYQYWALGHIHVRQILQEQPFIGYSGSLQGLNHKEVGPKGFYLVQSDENQQLVPTFRASAPLVWKTEILTFQHDEEVKIQDLIERVKHINSADEETFLLIQLKIETADRQQMQILNSEAFYQQLKNQIQPDDQIFIYRIDAQMQVLETVVPELPIQPNEKLLDQLVTLDNLNELGLNLVDNSTIFEMLTSSDNLAELKQQIQVELKNIQGGAKNVD